MTLCRRLECPGLPPCRSLLHTATIIRARRRGWACFDCDDDDNLPHALSYAGEEMNNVGDVKRAPPPNQVEFLVRRRKDLDRAHQDLCAHGPGDALVRAREVEEYFSAGRVEPEVFLRTLLLYRRADQADLEDAALALVVRGYLPVSHKRMVRGLCVSTRV